jgi:hypothetical protein
VVFGETSLLFARGCFFREQVVLKEAGIVPFQGARLLGPLYLKRGDGRDTTLMFGLKAQA